MFDRIAPRYDPLNRLLSAGTDVRAGGGAPDLLELEPPAARAFDLCTGTADLLIEAVGRDPRNSGLGVDLAQGCWRGASTSSRGAGPRGARLVGGDGERLPVREAGPTRPSSASASETSPIPLVALRGAPRAAAGGRFVVLEFSMPEGLLGRLTAYFTAVLPRIGGLVSGDRSAYSYPPRSRASRSRGLCGAAEQAGFGAVRLSR
jgi:demethylmenaquinone methyltransferase/2-methoxy-6-polyprenyl-1,4-benzoquinol methylase